MRRKPDVIVSDIDMPVMNGFDMVKRIRETDGDTVILFTSALTSPKDVTFGYEIGVDNYVKKPIIPEELDAHVRSLLRLRGGNKRRSETHCYKFGVFTLMKSTPLCAMMRPREESSHAKRGRHTRHVGVKQERGSAS
jgi:DNA-binding response OmpR family regulator